MSAEFRANHYCRVHTGRLMRECGDCVKRTCHECHHKCEEWWADWCRGCFRKPDVQARYEAAPLHHPRAY